MRYKISFPAWIWLWQHVISRSLYNWIFQSAWTNHFVSSSLRYSEMVSLHADHSSPCVFTCEVAEVAVECFPKLSRRVPRPWISNTTLQLISDRDVARAHGNHELEKTLTKSSKNSVKNGQDAMAQ